MNHGFKDGFFDGFCLQPYKYKETFIAFNFLQYYVEYDKGYKAGKICKERRETSVL